MVKSISDHEVFNAIDILGEQLGIRAAANPRAVLTGALLGSLLHHLLEQSDDELIYLEPTLRVTGALDRLSEALATSEVALVCRPTALGARDLPAEGHTKGIYSTRVLGVSPGPEARQLLEAWPHFLIPYRGDEGLGNLTAWFESIPARVKRTAIVSDPAFYAEGDSLAGCTPAYSAPSGVVMTGGNRVSLVDFGAIDPDDPLALLAIREFNENERERAELAAFVEGHAQELRASITRELPRASPAYESFADGQVLTDTLRSLVAAAVRDGRLTHNPFRESGRRELYEYLKEPASSGAEAGLTRVHMEIWRRRDDLRAAYPHLDGPDGAGFAGWLCVHGPREEGLTPELLPPSPDVAFRDADPNVQLQPQRFGVNVVGFFNSELGVGEMARLLATGLDGASVPFLPVKSRLRPPSRAAEPFQTVAVDEAVFPLNIICINGDGVPVFAREVGRAFFRDRYNVALWWWEVGPPPSSWHEAYDFIDEVWVGTRYVYDLIAPTSPVPVVLMPMPLRDISCSPSPRESLGLPGDGFVFLCLYDYHSVLKRKNPSAVIAAFRRAFDGVDGVHLVLKTLNGDMRPDEHARVLMEAAGDSSIHVIDGYLSASTKNTLLAACDCYVSLHRAEGFGLTLAEAMLLEIPVIATRYGGNVDFMSERNSYLVDYSLVQVGEDAYPYSPDAWWAEPSIEHAASLMRRVFEQQEEARSRGSAARRDLLRDHSPANAGATIKRRLEMIHERRIKYRVPNPRHMRSLSIQLAGSERSERASKEGTSRAHTVARTLRQTLLRFTGVDARMSELRGEATRLRGDVEQLKEALLEADQRTCDVARALDEQGATRHAEYLAELRKLQASCGVGMPGDRRAGRRNQASESELAGPLFNEGQRQRSGEA